MVAFLANMVVMIKPISWMNACRGPIGALGSGFGTGWAVGALGAGIGVCGAVVGIVACNAMALPSALTLATRFVQPLPKVPQVERLLRKANLPSQIPSIVGEAA